MAWRDLVNPTALPDSVVSILHRKLLERRRLILREGLIDRAQFRNENAVKREAIEDDVVQGQIKAVLGL